MKECKSLAGEREAVFWAAQLLQEGKHLLTKWNIVRTAPPFVFNLFLPLQSFCFHSVPLDFLPHLEKKRYNKQLSIISHFWVIYFIFIIKYLPQYLLPFFHLFRIPELNTKRFTSLSLQQFCFLWLLLILLLLFIKPGCFDEIQKRNEVTSSPFPHLNTKLLSER